MIVHVMRKALMAQVGDVVVATDSEAVAAAVEKAGGRAVMTRADHVSGSDRIYEALEALDPEHRCEHRGQCAGRPADPRPRRHPGRLAAARRPGGRYRDARRRDPRPRRTDQSERGEGDRRDGRARPAARHDLHARRCAAAPARITTTSGSTLTGARRSSASSSCRRRPTSGASSSSNCARSTPACASTSPWSASVPLGVDTPEELAKARALLGG